MADSVTHIVNPHLHVDHCGGNGQLPNATVVVQRIEVDAARDGGNERGYVDDDLDLWSNVTQAPRRLG